MQNHCTLTPPGHGPRSAADRHSTSGSQIVRKGAKELLGLHERRIVTLNGSAIADATIRGSCSCSRRRVPVEHGLGDHPECGPVHKVVFAELAEGGDLWPGPLCVADPVRCRLA